MNNNNDNQELLNSIILSIENIKMDMNDLKKSLITLENNHKTSKKELKELKENFIKLKGTTIIF